MSHSSEETSPHMKLLFLSDIHGVPSALEAAFASADALGYDRIVLLGDIH